MPLPHIIEEHGQLFGRVACRGWKRQGGGIGFVGFSGFGAGSREKSVLAAGSTRGSSDRVKVGAGGDRRKCRARRFPKAQSRDAALSRDDVVQYVMR